MVQCCLHNFCFGMTADVIFCFSILVIGSTGFVNEAGCQTFVFKQEVIFIPAVTSIFSIFRLVPDYLFVVSLDDARHVVHATVPHFYSVLD